MRSPLAVIAIWAAKAAMWLSRLLGKGKGSSLPGMIALKIAPGILHSFTSQLRSGAVLVTGTNGKTTTNNMLAQVTSAAGYRVISNREGANLATGVTTAFIRASNLLGRIDCDFATLEVDEGAFPGVSRQVGPLGVVITNFFRDQLDRYGELDTTVHLVEKALAREKNVKLVLNADDPLVAQMGDKTGHDPFFYGLGYVQQGVNADMGDTREAKFCPFCGAPLQYKEFFYSQLGDYSCTGCNFSRPTPRVEAHRLHSRGETFSASLRYAGEEIQLTVPAGGIYNYYNALAAFSAAAVLGIKPGRAVDVLRSYIPATGRMEHFQYQGKQVFLNLVKNPTGFNQALVPLLSKNEKKKVLISINDNDADGRDISWLWDVNFEALAVAERMFTCFVCTGKRGEEMALRLKYAGVSVEKIIMEKDPEKALTEVLAGKSGTVYLLATYTALWPLEALLSKKAERIGQYAEDMSSVS